MTEHQAPSMPTTETQALQNTRRVELAVAEHPASGSNRNGSMADGIEPDRAQPESDVPECTMPESSVPTCEVPDTTGPEQPVTQCSAQEGNAPDGTAQHGAAAAGSLARDLTHIWLSSCSLVLTPDPVTLAPEARPVLEQAIDRRRGRAKALALAAPVDAAKVLAREVKDDVGDQDSNAILGATGLDPAAHRRAMLLALSSPEVAPIYDPTRSLEAPDLTSLAPDDLPPLRHDAGQVLAALVLERAFDGVPDLLRALMTGSPCLVIEVPNGVDLAAVEDLLPLWLHGPRTVTASLLSRYVPTGSIAFYLEVFTAMRGRPQVHTGTMRETILAAAAQARAVVLLVAPNAELPDYALAAETNRLKLPPLSVDLIARAIALFASDCGPASFNQGEETGPAQRDGLQTVQIETASAPVALSAHPADLADLTAFGVAALLRRGETAATMVARLMNKLEPIAAARRLYAAEDGADGGAADPSDAGSGSATGGHGHGNGNGKRSTVGGSPLPAKGTGSPGTGNAGQALSHGTKKYDSEVIDPSKDPAIPLLSELAGYGEAGVWGLELARDIADVRAGTISWREVDRGLVLVGPPGVGKTIFAKSLAKSCGVNFLASSFARWEGNGDHHGDVVKLMRAHFDDARAHAPCIMLVDEIDSIPNRDQLEPRARSWWHSLVNAVLEQLDGSLAREGVVVIGACNNASRLDPALTRAGRLEKIIPIPYPSTQDLAAIFRFHLKADLPDADLLALSEGLVGFTGGDVEAAVRAARRSARRAARAMTAADLDAAIYNGVSLSDAQLWRTAVHEAGHAIVAVAVDHELQARMPDGDQHKGPVAMLHVKDGPEPAGSEAPEPAAQKPRHVQSQVETSVAVPAAAPDPVSGSTHAEPSDRQSGPAPALSPAPETRHHVSPVDFITVRARGKVGGFVRFREDDHPVLPPRRAVLATVARKLGGRAAEIVQLGEADGGSGGPEGSDLAIATRMLAEVAARHGLGRDGSLIWHPHRDKNKSMPAAIAAAVEADLQDQQTRAEAIIAANAELVVELASRLIADRTIDAETFARDFAGRVTWEAGG